MVVPRLAKLAQPYIDKLPEGLFRQLLLKKLSDRTGLDTHYLEAHFQESARTRESTTNRPEPETHNTPPSQEEHFQHSHYEPEPFYNTDYEERQYTPEEHPRSYHDRDFTQAFISPSGQLGKTGYFRLCHTTVAM